MATLVVITNNGHVEQIELKRESTTVGRADQSDIVIRGAMVSRIHALVSRVRGSYLVRDLDSSNGTFVNGLRVRRHMLRHEDVIRIGDYELRFLDDTDDRRTVRASIYSLV